MDFFIAEKLVYDIFFKGVFSRCLWFLELFLHFFVVYSCLHYVPNCTCKVCSFFLSATNVTRKYVKTQHYVTNCPCKVFSVFLSATNVTRKHVKTQHYVTNCTCQVCSFFLTATNVTRKHVKRQHYVTNCTCKVCSFFLKCYLVFFFFFRVCVLTITCIP